VPETQSVPGAFLAFSTGLLDLARSDGELQGVAARELACEYFTLPSSRGAEVPPCKTGRICYCRNPPEFECR
jgi:hypothetical protein